MAVLAHVFDPQPHRAVREIENRILLHRVGEVGPGDRHATRVAQLLDTADERHPVTGLELDHVALERADAQLRAGQVLQDRDRASRLAGCVTNAADGLGVLLERAV
jgi:hypothetical protein